MIQSSEYDFPEDAAVQSRLEEQGNRWERFHVGKDSIHNKCECHSTELIPSIHLKPVNPNTVWVPSFDVATA